MIPKQTENLVNMQIIANLMSDGTVQVFEINHLKKTDKNIKSATITKQEFFAGFKHELKALAIENKFLQAKEQAHER